MGMALLFFFFFFYKTSLVVKEGGHTKLLYAPPPMPQRVTELLGKQTNDTVTGHLIQIPHLDWAFLTWPIKNSMPHKWTMHMFILQDVSDVEGRCPTEGLMKDINSQASKNIMEWNSFQGMICYYWTFLPNLESDLKPFCKVTGTGM
jgi:hypothetical protein